VAEFPALAMALERVLGLSIFPKGVFEALTDEEKGQAFTVARLASEGAIEAARDSLARLLTIPAPGGKPVIHNVRDWRREVWDDLAKKYGKPGSENPAYIDLVFRQTWQTSHAAGKYAKMFSPLAVRIKPYVKYLAIMDARTRAEHRALNGMIFRKMDLAARRYYPPLGFNCRCKLRELTAEEVQKKGLEITNGDTLSGVQLRDEAGAPLVDKDGQPVLLGPPPEGWDADRVLSLVPDSLKPMML